MKTIGIKLADGSFYPILEEGTAEKKELNLTTVKDNQTTVQVDLYRSSTGTMEDAEYVDSLEIKNLVKHPNGEPDIALDISLDENNELKAELHDPETGRDSSTTVDLVSRTLEQRSEPSDIIDVGTDRLSDETVADISSDLDFDTESFDEITTTEEEFDLDATLANSTAEEDFTSGDDFTFDPNSLNVDEIVEEEAVTPQTEEIDEPEQPVEENHTMETVAVAAGAGLLGAAAAMALNSKEKEQVEETVADDDFSIDDINLDDTLSEDTEVVSDTLTTDDQFTSEIEDTPLTSDDLSLPEEFDIDSSLAEDSADTVTDTDAGALTFADDTIISEETDTTDTDFSLDEINFDEPLETDTVSDEDTTVTDETDFSMDDFTIPEEEPISFDESETSETFAEEDTAFSLSDDQMFEQDADMTASGSAGLDFSDILDEETKEGYAASHDNTEVIKKKTKTPVIICVVCAIICIIAVLLILFLIPSKYNLLTKSNTEKPVVEQPASVPEVKQEETVKPVEAPKHEAKENEIVVAPAEEVVPEVPKTPAPESKNITYKIKWGDTLWDLAKSYYNNPWKYPKIAKYNGIKNPDHIISGTTIIIPAE